MSKEHKDYRQETDFLGEVKISNACYYGVQTLRASQNFNITDVQLSQYPLLVIALAQVKKACCLANLRLNKLAKSLADPIVSACDEIIDGKWHDQFIVDPIQGGAGTSTNMNANEVIANRALELMGKQKGQYDILHPNNHVNMSQSTNDVYPSAFRIALYFKINQLERAMNILKKSLFNKKMEFQDVIKMGRTQLQDAVPMTLGQEFGTFQTIVAFDLKALTKIKDYVLEMNLGGTAIGTGINSHPLYSQMVQECLQEITGQDFYCASNLIEATQNTGTFVEISGILKKIAIRLSKICNDLRLLSSGPRTGLNEINLPPMQPGSSIMPGKVNPVIPEVVNQVAFQVIGSDMTISLASEGGQLQLNVFEPIVAYNLFQSINMLSRACESLATKCIDGITANKEHCQELVSKSISIITGVTPKIGYQKASQIARRALRERKTIQEILLEEQIFTEEELSDQLDLMKLTNRFAKDN